jgi:transcriptional regulator with XRE-family HTH domain
MGGPGSGRKADNRRHGEALDLAARGWSLGQIGERLGLSREWVRQILHDAGHTSGRLTLRCQQCGEPIVKGRLAVSNRPALCLACLAGNAPAGFPERLKAHRLAAGLSRRQLAHLAGRHRETIAAYEQGKRRPKLDSVRNLAGALGVTPAMLAGNGDPPAQP